MKINQEYAMFDLSTYSISSKLKYIEPSEIKDGLFLIKENHKYVQFGLVTIIDKEDGKEYIGKRDNTVDFNTPRIYSKEENNKPTIRDFIKKHIQIPAKYKERLRNEKLRDVITDKIFDEYISGDQFRFYFNPKENERIVVEYIYNKDNKSRQGGLEIWGNNNEEYQKGEIKMPEEAIINEKEIDLVNKIYMFINYQEYVFYVPHELVANYYISLKAGPFVILTGISGTLKSRLTKLFARAVCEDIDKQYILLPIGADWNDDRQLIGFYNPILKHYQSTELLDFIIAAGEDLDNPYFVCLDEMNIARVEYYFSKFLSILESDDKKITLHNNKDGIPSQDGKIIKHEINIPHNLFFIGTVNMDETTYRFSPKVLDRANTIEIENIDIADWYDKWSEKKKSFNDTTITKEDKAIFKQCFINDDIRKNGRDKALKYGKFFNWLVKNIENFKFLDKVNEKLRECNLSAQQSGMRTRRQIMYYTYFACTLRIPLDKTLDLQIMQKILPKIKGEEETRGILTELPNLIGNNKTKSIYKINKMYERLKFRGYTEFYE